MNTDPANTDVESLVDDIRNHRFDGYSANRISREIDSFRSGVGAGSISEAVDALDRVAAALTETEHTLRSELDKLGVSWTGAGSEGAFAEFDQQAGFSGEMADTLGTVSRVLYEQGDAFNRTRDQLPDAAEVRKALGGRSLGDDTARVLGFETEHATEVAEGSEAREHAVQLLHEYVATSGNGLGSLLDTLVPDVPQFSVITPRPDADDGGADGGSDGSGDSSAVDTLMSGEPGASATSGSGPAAAGAAAFPGSTPAGQTTQSDLAGGVATSSETMTSGVAPPAGSADPQVSGIATGTPGAGSGGYDSGAPTTGGSTGEHRGVAGVVGQVGPGGAGNAPPGHAPSGEAQSGHAQQGHAQSGVAERAGGRVGGSPGPESGTAGRTIGRVTVPGAGEQPAVAAPGNNSYTPLSPVDGGSSTHQNPLAKGSMSGVGPQPTATSGQVDGGPAPAGKTGMRATDLGAGVAALGAGGTSGAMSSGEPHGRGVGRSAPHAGSVERAVSFGPAPDEETAEAVRRVDGDATRYREAGVLRHATDGEDVAAHTRSFGVDHTDLFSDPRLVAPERIETGEADELDGGR